MESKLSPAILGYIKSLDYTPYPTDEEIEARREAIGLSPNNDGQGYNNTLEVINKLRASLKDLNVQERNDRLNACDDL